MHENAKCPCGREFIMKSIEIDNFHLCPRCREYARRENYKQRLMQELVVAIEVPESVVESIIQAQEEYLAEEQEQEDEYAAYSLASEWLASQLDTAHTITDYVLSFYDIPHSRDE